MAKVTNLKITLQPGTESTIVASWDFRDPTSSGSSGGSGGSGGGGGGSAGGPVRAGSLVKVNQGAVWYNGVGIASFVFGDTWRVLEVSGDRVVINQNQSGTHRIMSAISSKYLTVVG